MTNLFYAHDEAYEEYQAICDQVLREAAVQAQIDKIDSMIDHNREVIEQRWENIHGEWFPKGQPRKNFARERRLLTGPKVRRIS